MAGFGNFRSNPGETDMLLRNAVTGAFEVYDICNNAITGTFALGTVGQDWLVAGFGPISGGGKSDMVLRNSLSGAFEVHDIANNQITAAAPMGQVGLDWRVAGIAPGPSTASLAPPVARTLNSCKRWRGLAVAAQPRA
jgi:hypothetical protein